MKVHEMKRSALVFRLSLAASTLLGLNACSEHQQQNSFSTNVTCVKVDNDPILDLTSMTVHPFIDNNLARKNLTNGRVSYIMCPNGSITISRDNHSTVPDVVDVVDSLATQYETMREPCTISGAVDGDNTKAFELFWNKGGAFFTAVCAGK